jgi:hypothetical protein
MIEKEELKNIIARRNVAYISANTTVVRHLKLNLPTNSRP